METAVLSHLLKLIGLVLILGVLLLPGQESLCQAPAPSGGPSPGGAPPAQNGVSALERGPVHEAFAAPTAEPKPSPLVAKKPPANIDEMPPEEKPEGDAVWIPGYWGWDGERNNYLWVSGCWRVKPPGKDWVPGYWREQGEQWQWVAGFWANAQTQAPAEGQPVNAAANPVTYYPEPPAPPAVAPPPPAPSADMFYVPGAWVWYDGRYAWRAGYWQVGRPGYIWVASHYRWTPFGYVYVAGYWDLAVANRGVLYAPVAVDVAVIGPGFVYTPAYAIADSIVLGALFIQPAYCHYYFGDYYGPRYVGLGFESCFVYSRRCYEPIVTYQVWTYRSNPGWLNAQVNITVARNAGLAPIPGREVILRPGREVIVARGQRIVTVPPAARVQAMQVAQASHVAAIEHRMQAERPVPGRTLTQPRQATARVATPPSNHPGTVTPNNAHQPNGVHNPQGTYKPSPYGSAGKQPGSTQPGGGSGRPGTTGHLQPGHTPANTKGPPPRTPPRREPPRKDSR
jgi:hypothetical protein